MPKKGQIIPVETRFWRAVKKTSGCWLWTGARETTGGYGVLTLYKPERHRKYPTMKAHRFAYELMRGPIPKGLLVCHKCDNPICVRWDHLFLGTSADNMKDRDRKGHTAHPKGVLNGGAKLSESIVKQIRKRYAVGSVNQRELGKQFGISQATISVIISRKKWRHIK